MQLRSRKIKVLIPFLLLIFGTGTVALAEDPFPLPRGLKPAVNFWVSIFTKYSKNQAIVHDAEHLDIIYDVMSLTSRSNTKGKRRRWRSTKHIRNHYTSLFRRWARQNPNPQKLSLKKKRIYRQLRKKGRSFRRASRNVRVQQGLREKFRLGIARSGLYLQEMRRIFKKYGLPEELTYLPHVESSFDHRAYSRLGAAGLWQFTRSTGRLFLTIDYDLDERRDPMKATDAAARLLRQNYRTLRSWPLAITAYNHGRAGMANAVRRVGTRDLPTIIRKYKGRTFGFASRNFYAEFLAARRVAKKKRHYFGSIRMQKPRRYQTFRMPSYVLAKVLTDQSHLTFSNLKNYNLGLRKPVLLGQRRIPRGYLLRVPAGQLSELRRHYAALPIKYKHKNQKRMKYYRVKKGDSLGTLARRFRTTVRTLAAVNDVNNVSRIRAGQVLSIPQKGRAATRTPRKFKNSRFRKTKKNPNITNGTKKLANKKKVMMRVTGHKEKLAKQGGLPTVRMTSQSSRQGWTRVEGEETLGHFAQWLKINPKFLRSLNKLGPRRIVRVNQKLFLNFRHTTPKEFQNKRLEFHKSLQEDFFESYRVVGTFHHTMKKGESLWELAKKKYEVPFWVIARYNPPDLFRSKVTAGTKVAFPLLVPRERNS